MKKNKTVNKYERYTYKTNERETEMTRGQTKNNKHKNKAKLSQTPDKDIEKTNDGLDVEYSKELADAEDVEAQQRSKEADRRAHSQNK